MEQMTYDCFLYFNEEELLNIRLHELENVVDYHVIVESAHTFTGIEKGFNFDISKFESFKDKIIYRKLLFDQENTPHRRQYIQRDFLSECFTCKNDDIIIIGDLDEIPSKNSISFLNEYIINAIDTDLIYFINHRTYCNYLNLYLGMYYGTKVLSGWKYKHMDSSVQKVRDYWVGDDIIRQGGLGWHFSWLGGKDRVRKKLASIAHYDGKLTAEEIEIKANDIDNLRDTLGRPLAKVDIDLNYPKYIYDNQEKFKDLIYV